MGEEAPRQGSRDAEGKLEERSCMELEQGGAEMGKSLGLPLGEDRV